MSVYVLNMSNYSIHMSVHMYRHMPIHMSVRLLHNIMWINRCVCLTGQALLARYSLSTQNVSSYRPSVAARPQCGPAARLRDSASSFETKGVGLAGPEWAGQGWAVDWIG